MDDDLHYRRFRDEHARALDDDYDAWRRQRTPTQAGGPPDHVQPRDEKNPLRSLGRAISDAVTGSEGAPSST